MKTRRSARPSRGRQTASDSLQHRLHRQLQRKPAGRAIGFITAGGDVTWHSWQDFMEASAGYAAWLAEQGLRRGDVCVLALNSDEACAKALTGILLLGGLPLLVAPPMLQETNSILRDVLIRTARRAGARVAVVPEAMGTDGHVAEAGRRTRFVALPETAPAPQRPPVVRPSSEEVGAMQLTSGTTGFPRICVWKQRGILAALHGMRVAMQLSERDVCFNWTPLYHDMGLVNNFFLCLTSGVPVIMARPQDFIRRPSMWLRGLSDTGSTVAWSPNFGFTVAAQRIRDDELTGVRLDHVRAFYSAAERIHLGTMQAFYRRFAPFGLRPDALKTNFGCAENVGGATFSDPTGPYIFERVDRALFYGKAVARPVPDASDADAVVVVGVGRPVPGMRVAVLSPAGRPLPDGHVGELAFETPSRMAGYLHDKVETRRALYRKWLRTSDLGYVRGKEVFWVGRRRERITVRGRKFDPSEFERILFDIPGLRPGCFAAFGIDDADLGTERLVIVAEVRDADTGRVKELAGQIREQVATQTGLGVDDVVLVKSGTLTKTSSGKRRHRFFREAYLDGRLKPFVLLSRPA